MVKAGDRYGLRNRCPRCGMTPPRGMKTNRWRWMTVHISRCGGQ